jgi:hypothetical protein
MSIVFLFPTQDLFFPQRLFQDVFQQFSGFKMSFAPGRNVNDIAGTGISGFRFGFGLFDLKNTKVTDLDSDFWICFTQNFPQGFEDSVDKIFGNVYFLAQFFGHSLRDFFFSHSLHI